MGHTHRNTSGQPCDDIASYFNCTFVGIINVILKRHGVENCKIIFMFIKQQILEFHKSGQLHFNSAMGAKAGRRSYCTGAMADRRTAMFLPVDMRPYGIKNAHGNLLRVTTNLKGNNPVKASGYYLYHQF